MFIHVNILIYMALRSIIMYPYRQLWMKSTNMVWVLCTCYDKVGLSSHCQTNYRLLKPCNRSLKHTCFFQVNKVIFQHFQLNLRYQIMGYYIVTIQIKCYGTFECKNIFFNKQVLCLTWHSLHQRFMPETDSLEVISQRRVIWTFKT